MLGLELEKFAAKTINAATMATAIQIGALVFFPTDFGETSAGGVGELTSADLTGTVKTGLAGGGGGLETAGSVRTGLAGGGGRSDRFGSLKTGLAGGGGRSDMPAASGRV